MIKAGPHNDLTDVPGLRVGAAHDAAAMTGVSVIVFDEPAIIAGDVRGGGPGARETDLLDPSTLVDRADAVVLAGGSSYGLAAADGAAGVLGARGRGFSLVKRPGVPPSPIVPAAILYDLANGGDKSWGAVPPYAALGRAATLAALGESPAPTAQSPAPTAQPYATMALGRAGAGLGAMAGKGAGGLGAASYRLTDAERTVTIAAAMAVNSFGSPYMPNSDIFWAWPFEMNDEFGGRRPQARRGTSFAPAADWPDDTKAGAGLARANTTIGLVATDAPLTQAEARRVAIMAQDGLARALRPVHGPTDGDIIFVASTASPSAHPPLDPLALTRLGMIAADCVARAIARGVFESERQAGKAP